METKPKYFVYIVSGIVIFLALILLFGLFRVIDAGSRGVVLRLGSVNRIMLDGLNWKIPLFERVVEFNVKTQTITYDDDIVAMKEDKNAMPSLGGASKDLQLVKLAVVVNWRYLPDKVGEVYARYGSTFFDAVVQPIVRDSLKAASAKFSAEALIARRAEFVDEAGKIVKEQFENKTNLAVFERLNVVDIDFTDEFNKAIEAKVTAEQNALTAKNKLEQVKFEAEQRIAQAKGEAEAIRIQAQAITQQGGKDYVSLKSIEKWNGVLPVNLYGSAPIPFININQ